MTELETEMAQRSVVLVIMDGVGRGDGGPGDAVAKADMPVLKGLLETCPHVFLKAHGTAVGLPSDGDIGNSEVGHNTMGCGQVYNQGAKLVNESIATSRMWSGSTWRELVGNCLEKNSTMHFIGLLSDGNVHSNTEHLKAMLLQCVKEGIKRARVHILLDGRDVPPTSALGYIDDLEQTLAECRDAGMDGKIASGGGRMKITMDRYEADWAMVERGWNVHVRGEGRMFPSARAAVKAYREETPGVIDQDLEPFVIGEDGVPVGAMGSDDSVILFNFRGDRAMELSRAFDEREFDKFDRGDAFPRMFAGMLEYDSDTHVPRKYLLEPPQIENTMTQFLNSVGAAQFAVSETQKFGHVTYFWNGNRSGRQNEELETFVEIPSDNVSFDTAPRMKSAQIALAVTEAVESGRYRFIRCNFPNGDMVGHTGNFPATVEGLEAVDEGLGQILEAARKAGYIMAVTADHGNADDMLSVAKDGTVTPKTSHSLNRVPFIVWDGAERHDLVPGDYGLANIAATLTELMGLPVPPQWEKSMLA